MVDNFVDIDGLRLKKKVRAIITNEDNQFLLIRPHGYKADSWTFVGGGVEENESDIEALYRELKEEVNIDDIASIKESSLVNWFAFSESFKAKKNVDYDGQHAKYFHVSVPNATQVTIQHCEVADYCWSSDAEVLNRITISKHREIFNFIAEEFKLLPCA
jgi:8-oxo-dGTP pyrophosphatase MutT (NUDIX family)